MCFILGSVGYPILKSFSKIRTGLKNEYKALSLKINGIKTLEGPVSWSNLSKRRPIFNAKVRMPSTVSKLPVLCFLVLFIHSQCL